MLVHHVCKLSPAHLGIIVCKKWPESSSSLGLRNDVHVPTSNILIRFLFLGGLFI